MNEKELIFLKPFCKKVLWGGHKIRDEYHYTESDENIGEAWTVSSRRNATSYVLNGKYKGMSLHELFDEHRELFGNIKTREFPLLVKIIDARDNLSIQVHPGDEYAYHFENGEKGKTECWYVLDCDKDADIVIGHNAENRDEFKNLAENGKWDKLLNVLPIKKGDFFYIPSGTVHAIRKGTVILEIQQNSDITYRLYDYDRIKDGKKRELHIEKALECVNYPGKYVDRNISVSKRDGYEISSLLESEFFTVKLYDIHKCLSLSANESFLTVSVIDGDGYIDGLRITKGSNFIIPYKYENIRICGNLKILITSI